MKREIKFRGLRTDGKGWVYGSFIHNSIDCPCIIDYDAEQYEIIPKTIGQFTGLKDKNGKDIYQGDKFNPISENLTYTVVFKDAQFGLESELGYWGSLKRYFELSEKHGWSCEVIGNIHEAK